jgi:DNA-binding GntR family transcriptional regulator
MVARAVNERDPDQQEAEFLCLDGQRVHTCTQVTYLPARQTLETCVHAFPADRWDLRTGWNANFPG